MKTEKEIIIKDPENPLYQRRIKGDYIFATKSYEVKLGVPVSKYASEMEKFELELRESYVRSITTIEKPEGKYSLYILEGWKEMNEEERQHAYTYIKTKRTTEELVTV